MELIDRRCCVCGSDNFEQVFLQEYDSIAALEGLGYKQNIVICKVCGFVFSNPSPNQDALSSYYSAFNNYENPQACGNVSSQRMKEFWRSYSLIAQHFPEKYTGKVLDIGCATGAALSIFKSKGWHVLGIEPSVTCANMAGQLYGIDVIAGDFNPSVVAEKGPFDVVTLSGVLEHLLAPDLLLDQIRPLVNHGGLVYIEVPNLLRPALPFGYFSFEHVNYFTPVTLTYILKAHGFAPQIELFENLDDPTDIYSSYPAIGAVGKKQAVIEARFESGYESALKAINEYKASLTFWEGKIRDRVDSVVKNTAKGKLAIWGAGMHTSQLLSLTALKNEPIACVFDTDPKKHGHFIKNVPIIGLDTEKVEYSVDAILISSLAFENQIYEQIKFLKHAGIKIHKLYDFMIK